MHCAPFAFVLLCACFSPAYFSPLFAVQTPGFPLFAETRGESGKPRFLSPGGKRFFQKTPSPGKTL